MAIILNLIAFAGCIVWFHRLMNQAGRKLIFPVILAYLGATLLSFIFALAVEHDYLDGLLHLIVSGVSILLFWLWTSVVVIVKHTQSSQTKYIPADLAQTSILLIFPLLIVFMISNMSFKIGG